MEVESLAAEKRKEKKGPILHVVVIGFHHKKGCQVEYSYPPLIRGNKVDSHDCPENWKHLPSLALPDGSHNYEKDTIYFVMPSTEEPKTTVFCVSCYRQMNAEDLLNRSADITRGTVQKSVCVISKLPLFGLIQAKLELITHAYFDERDFSKVSLLEDTFRNLNDCLSAELVSNQQVFLGMSARDLVIHFKHKVLLLFKLLLLERKVLFFKTPVKHLCSSILSLLSLYPGMIEHGLNDAAVLSMDNDIELDQHMLDDNNKMEINFSTGTKAKYSPGCEMKNNLDAATPENRNKEDEFVPKRNNFEGGDNFVEKAKQSLNKQHLKNNSTDVSSSPKVSLNLDVPPSDKIPLTPEIEDLLDSDSKDKAYMFVQPKLEFNCSEIMDLLDEDEVKQSPRGSQSSLASKESAMSIDGGSSSSKMANIKGRVFGAINYWTGRNPNTSPTSESVHQLETSIKDGSFDESEEKNISDSEAVTVPSPILEERLQTPPSVVISMDSAECGLPLELFSNGFICHPYVSLPYLDLISDTHVMGFLVGATNVLFKQKPQLSDVLVEVDEGKIEIHDLELRKQLHLTTEDLRFADFIVRNVTAEEKEDIFLNGTGWEGGDDWVRAQFKYYLLCLLRTSLADEPNKDLEAFNPTFVDAWKETRNYKLWFKDHSTTLQDITSGHPCQGQLSVSDMKLRLSHTIQSSERGRRINQAMSNTGKAVIQTSKAVGGAISHAKSAMSSWFLTFSAPTQPSEQAYQ